MEETIFEIYRGGITMDNYTLISVQELKDYALKAIHKRAVEAEVDGGDCFEAFTEIKAIVRFVSSVICDKAVAEAMAEAKEKE